MWLAAKHADAANVTWELGRAGKFDTGYLTRFDEAKFKERVDYLAGLCEKNGRRRDAVQISNLIGSCVVTDSDTATAKTLESIAQALGFTVEQARHCPMLLVGTPEGCIKELNSRVKALDISQFIVMTKSEKTIRTLAEKVFPHVS